MSEPTYYDILGVTPDATQDEIQRALRRQQQYHHPDKKTGSLARSKLLNQARDELSDPLKRREYDRKIAMEQPFDAEAKAHDPRAKSSHHASPRPTPPRPTPPSHTTTSTAAAAYSATRSTSACFGRVCQTSPAATKNSNPSTTSNYKKPRAGRVFRLWLPHHANCGNWDFRILYLCSIL